jgi:hypothetical protein
LIEDGDIDPILSVPAPENTLIFNGLKHRNSIERIE